MISFNFYANNYLSSSNQQHKYPKQSLPSWSKVNEGYPKDQHGNDLPADQVYEKIGGKPGSLAKASAAIYSNACAARLSMALINAGVNIPNRAGITCQGANGKYYFTSATEVYKFVTETFEGNVTYVNGYESSVSPSGFKQKVAGQHGLYVLKPSYPAKFGATGHATLYDGNSCVGGNQGCYFSAMGGVSKIAFIALN